MNLTSRGINGVAVKVELWKRIMHGTPQKLFGFIPWFKRWREVPERCYFLSEGGRIVTFAGNYVVDVGDEIRVES